MRLIVIMSLVLFASHVFMADVTAQEDTAFIQTPVFSDALDYEQFPKMDGCAEERVPIVKYHACRDSRTLYEAALTKANEAGKPLMIIFGFNKCPYCVVLERGVFDPNRPVRGGNIARYFSESQLKSYLADKKALEIPVLRLHARSDHGLKLADELGITKMAQDRGWHRVWSPFVVFVNPQTGVMASESEWEAKEIYCDWSVNVAVSLENIGMATKGAPYTERKRCPKS